MAEFPKMTTTKIGISMIAKSIQDNNESNKLIITGFAFGSGQIDEESEDIRDLTELKEFKKRIDVNKYINNEDGTLSLESNYDNSDVDEGFWFRELGVLAKNGTDGEEKLLAYSNAGNLTTYISDKFHPQPINSIIVGIIIGDNNNFDVVINLSNAATLEQLNDHNNNLDSHKNIQDKLINQINSQFRSGFDNYIEKGFKVESYENNSLVISEGVAIKNKQAIKIDKKTELNIPVNSVGITYIDHNDNEIKYKQAIYPENKIDNNTVGFWVFNNTDAGAKINNLARGKSTSAVDNDFIPHGGIESVDGYIGKSLRTDGSTGYFETTNSINFPLSNSELQIDFLFTFDSLYNTSRGNYILSYTINQTSNNFNVRSDTSKSLVICEIDTKYTLEENTLYFLQISIFQGIATVYINGAYLANITFAGNETQPTNLLLGTPYSKDMAYNSNITIHYLELKNKAKTYSEVMSTSNILCFPTFYNDIHASEPNTKTEYKNSFHQYLFKDEDSTLLDSNELNPINGNITGTKIITSKIGLGKARVFNGTDSDKIDLGNFACSTKFTFICVINLYKYADINFLFSCDDKTANRNMIFLKTAGKVILYNNSEEHDLLSGRENLFPLNSPTFLGITVDETKATIYINGNIKCNTTVPKLNTTEMPTFIGYGNANSMSFNGEMEYAMFGNFALTEIEMMNYYHYLFKYTRKDIVKDFLQDTYIVLCYVKTNSEKIIDYDDISYKYGRREKAVNGNRKVFLGWQYYNNAITDFKWDNPFKTKNVKTTFKYAIDIYGNQEQDILSYFTGNSVTYGILYYTQIYNTETDIFARIHRNGSSIVNKYYASSGFIGCYAEVMEDFYYENKEE